MDNGIQFFDIILFAMIAIFLVLRLRGVLGRRDGHEDDFPDIFKQALKRKKQEVEESNDNVTSIESEKINKKTQLDSSVSKTTLETNLDEIVAADKDFDVDEFISGARIAFEYILSAYASGDSNALKPLLSKEVFKNFDASICERNEAGQTMDETLIGISSAELMEAEMDGTLVQITVKFLSDQVHALSDRDGIVVEGDPDKIVSVIDLWTFSRDIRSDDPNWILIATGSPD